MNSNTLPGSYLEERENSMSERKVSSRSILTIIWGLLSVGLLGAAVGVASMHGPGYWLMLAFGGLQFLFLFMSVAYSLGREDQYLGLVNKKTWW